MTDSGDILIIKLGGLGDVLRTTPLLRRLEGRVTWVTQKDAFPLLSGSPEGRFAPRLAPPALQSSSSSARGPALHPSFVSDKGHLSEAHHGRGNPEVSSLMPIEKGRDILGKRFKLVVNFDEDDRACRLASDVSALKKVGARYNGKMKVYCAGSAPWFDMSLISRLGIREANRLKARCRYSYQHFIFNACGFRFQGEEYIPPATPAKHSPRIVALEPRAGPRWPAKAWEGYSELARILRREGFQVCILKQRQSLLDYLDDINRCGLLVSGDTLALHAGLALRKRVVGLFNCTSPSEIFGYRRMAKIVNPHLHDHFYKRNPAPDLAGSISVDCVAQAVRKLAKRNSIMV